MKSQLHNLALSIFTLSMKYNFVILPEWVPRSMNSIADSISRFSDYDDWSIDQSSFDLIDKLWGPHTVDRFASPTTRKLHKFNSRFWCSGSAGMDAFCQPWSDDNNYLCPPVSLIFHTIKYLKKSNGAGTLVTPRWPSAYFWPFICPDGNHYDTSVVDWRLLKISFIPPPIQINSVFNQSSTFLSLALCIDYEQAPRRSSKGFCSSSLGYCCKCLSG